MEDKKRTRDCYNCIVYGDMCKCRKGHDLDAYHQCAEVTEKFVLRGSLLSGCRNCKDFVNDWK